MDKKEILKNLKSILLDAEYYGNEEDIVFYTDAIKKLEEESDQYIDNFVAATKRKKILERVEKNYGKHLQGRRSTCERSTL